MKNKIFIGGLNFNTTEKMLMDKLSEYGNVVSLRIVTHTDTGVSKGFGFATFLDEEGAKKAIAELNNEMLDGRRVGVKEAIER
jgi:RNA recognition motif-containing protein